MSKLSDIHPGSRRYDIYSHDGKLLDSAVGGFDDRVVDADVSSDRAAAAIKDSQSRSAPKDAAPGFPEKGDITLRHPHFARVEEATLSAHFIFVRVT